MEVCALCSKKLNIFNIRNGLRLKTGESLCLSCAGKLYTETLSNLGNLTKDELTKLYHSQHKIPNEQKKKQIHEPQKQYVIEYKRTCNQCGKVWHSLEEREKYLQKEQTCNNCNMCASAVGSAGGNSHSWGTWTQSKRNEHTLKNEISRLKQCPNCQSGNYTQTTVRYEK